MGLLDALNTYEGQQGLGLLAAAGPRFDGAGFFQRLQEGMGSADKWKRDQSKAALEQMQIEEYKNKIEQEKIARAQKLSDIHALLQAGERRRSMVTWVMPASASASRTRVSISSVAGQPE